MADPTPAELFIPVLIGAVVGLLLGGVILAGIGGVIGAAFGSLYLSSDDDDSETKDK